MRVCVPTIVIALFAVCTNATPLPPRQTADQALKMAQWRSQAEKLSTEAAPALRAYLDSPAIRDVLKDCCPGIAHEPADALLRRVNEELEASELVHNFGARPTGNTVSDTTLQWQFYNASGYFSGIWEYIFLTNGSNNDPLIKVVEEDLRGFRAFGNGTGAINPSSFAEAVERPIYTALNTRQVDAGNPDFGPVSVVFNTGYAKNMTFVTPADSGMFVAICNSSFNKGNISSFWPGPLDCTQPAAPGTFGALNHVLLASERLWRPANTTSGSSPLASSLRRLYQRPAPPADTADTFTYLEADLAGNALLPAAVKFVIGGFSQLFGTEDGRLLQRWCAANGWALLWAPGLSCAAGYSEEQCAQVADGHGDNSSTLNNATGHVLQSGVRRLIDPVVEEGSRRPLNATTGGGAAARAAACAFQAAWDAAAGGMAGGALAPSAYMGGAWRAVWGGLAAQMPAGLGVRAIAARQCESIDRCVGVVDDHHDDDDDDGSGRADCVCYAGH